MLEYLFDNEWSQRADIEDLKSRLRRSARRKTQASSRASSEIRELRALTEKLENDVGELALLCRSLLSYLREQGQIDLDKFVEILHRIDAEDGVIDGQAGPTDPVVTTAGSLEAIDPPQSEPPAAPEPELEEAPKIEAPIPSKRRGRSSRYKKREDW